MFHRILLGAAFKERQYWCGGGTPKGRLTKTLLKPPWDKLTWGQQTRLCLHCLLLAAQLVCVQLFTVPLKNTCLLESQLKIGPWNQASSSEIVSDMGHYASPLSLVLRPRKVSVHYELPSHKVWLLSS